MSLTLPVQSVVDRAHPPDFYWLGPDLADDFMQPERIPARKAWMSHGLMPADPAYFPASIDPGSRACQIFGGCRRGGRYF